MYDPNGYVDPLRRRFQQPDPQVSSFQQPQPLMAQQSAPGPQQPMQWQPIGSDDQGGQQMDLSGMGALLKRFQKPKSATPSDAKQAWEAGGSL